MFVFDMVFAFWFQVPVWLSFSPMGPQPLVSTTATLQGIPMIGIYASWHWSMAHAKSMLSSTSCTAVSRGEHTATQTALLQPFNQYGGAYIYGGLAESPNLYLSYMVERGLLFQVSST